MLALSGATAHHNASDGDIDLFLITAKGRTWAVSFFLFACMKLLGLRRTICLNYLLGEDGLALPDRDPYTRESNTESASLGRPDDLLPLRARQRLGS